MFEASEFATHPMYSITQGGLDLQQVSESLQSSEYNRGICSHLLNVRLGTPKLRFGAVVSESRGCVACPNLHTAHHLV